MVKRAQLSKSLCQKFVFEWSLAPSPDQYDDQFYRKLGQLNEELTKLVAAEALFFWSNVAHNQQCQQV